MAAVLEMHTSGCVINIMSLVTMQFFSGVPVVLCLCGFYFPYQFHHFSFIFPLLLSPFPYSLCFPTLFPYLQPSPSSLLYNLLHLQPCSSLIYNLLPSVQLLPFPFPTTFSLFPYLQPSPSSLNHNLLPLPFSTTFSLFP